MSVQEIPLSPLPQAFLIALGAVTYRLRFGWNRIGGFWYLNIATRTGVPIALGIPLVPGADLLEQFQYLGFDGALVVQSDGNADDIPDATDLGVTGRVFFVSFAP